MKEPTIMYIWSLPLYNKNDYVTWNVIKTNNISDSVQGNLLFKILVKMFSTGNYTYDLALCLITITEQDSSIDVLYFLFLTQSF